MENIDRRPRPWVILTSLVDHDGSLNPLARDSVVMTVYNVTREAFASSYNPTPQNGVPAAGNNALYVVNTPIYIDLYIMFMANFYGKSYPEGLSALSRIISFFQQTPVFTQQNAENLAPEIPQLTMDLENLSPIDVNYVMSMLGTKYLPSAFYKLRMIPFASSAMIARGYAVTGTEAGAKGGRR